MKLSEAQAKHKAWSERNFKDRNPDHPLLGVIEEVGELCESVELTDGTSTPMALIVKMQAHLGRLAHIHLKRAQGIRKASTSFDRECDTIDQLAEIWDTYQNAAGYRPMFGEIDLEEFAPSTEKRDDAVADIQIYLLDFCSRHGIDVEKNLESTLKTVLKRDWTRDTVVGKAS